MIFKQPNVPIYRGERLPEYLRTLYAFLRDFTLEVWKFCDNIDKRITALEEGSE